VTAHSSTLDRFWSIRLLLVAAVALIVIAAVVALSQRHAPRRAPRRLHRQSQPRPRRCHRQWAAGSDDAAFEVVGTPGPRSIAARSLQETLSNAFTHFDLVNIQLESATTRPRPAMKLRRRAIPTPTIDFPARSNMATTARRVCCYRLIDVADGSIVWSRVFDRVLAVTKSRAESGSCASLPHIAGRSA